MEIVRNDPTVRVRIGTSRKYGLVTADQTEPQQVPGDDSQTEILEYMFSYSMLIV